MFNRCARCRLLQVGRALARVSNQSYDIRSDLGHSICRQCGEMHAKDVMAAFLSALVSANQESFALEKLELCLASPGFRTACSDGLLDHCHVTDPKGNVSRPLELAARRGYTSVVSELLALGASPALHSQVAFLLYIKLRCAASKPLIPARTRTPRQARTQVLSVGCSPSTHEKRLHSINYSRLSPRFHRRLRCESKCPLSGHVS